MGTGQIGLFYIDEKYRNNGLGKEILNNVINEMKNNNIKEIWAVTSKDHKFWSNVPSSILFNTTGIKKISRR